METGRPSRENLSRENLSNGAYVHFKMPFESSNLPRSAAHFSRFGSRERISSRDTGRRKRIPQEVAEPVPGPVRAAWAWRRLPFHKLQFL